METLTNGSWDIEDSLDLYQVPAWGKPYFGINAAGHVVVRPDGTRPAPLFPVKIAFAGA